MFALTLSMPSVGRSSELVRRRLALSKPRFLTKTVTPLYADALSPFVDFEAELEAQIDADNRFRWM